MRAPLFIAGIMSFLALSACGARHSSSQMKDDVPDTATGLPLPGDDTYTSAQVHDLIVQEYGSDPLAGSQPVSLLDLTPTICVAKNRKFIGQLFFSGKLPLSDSLAMTAALTACVQWVAQDTANRDAKQCYIAGCEPTVSPDPADVKTVLAQVIAKVFGQ